MFSTTRVNARPNPGWCSASISEDHCGTAVLMRVNKPQAALDSGRQCHFHQQLKCVLCLPCKIVYLYSDVNFGKLLCMSYNATRSIRKSICIEKWTRFNQAVLCILRSNSLVLFGDMGLRPNSVTNCLGRLTQICQHRLVIWYSLIHRLHICIVFQRSIGMR